MSQVFGEYPLHISLADDRYHVAPADVDSAAAAAIPDTFDKDQYPFMAARAAAHGYQFVVDPASEEAPSEN